MYGHLAKFPSTIQIPLLTGKLQIRDRQISISLGKPMIINDDDCDVNFPTGDDLPGESQDTISYILAQASLSIAGTCLFI